MKKIPVLLILFFLFPLACDLTGPAARAPASAPPAPALPRVTLAPMPLPTRGATPESGPTILRVPAQGSNIIGPISPDQKLHLYTKRGLGEEWSFQFSPGGEGGQVYLRNELSGQETSFPIQGNQGDFSQGPNHMFAFERQGDEIVFQIDLESVYSAWVCPPFSQARLMKVGDKLSFADPTATNVIIKLIDLGSNHVLDFRIQRGNERAVSQRFRPAEFLNLGTGRGSPYATFQPVVCSDDTYYYFRRYDNQTN